MVLSRGEVRALLAELRCQMSLVGVLVYGAGLRLMECLTLRVPELEFSRGEVWPPRGEGAMSG